MITLITGVPGSGKTAHVVEMILDELKAERKIYVLGIPDLIASHSVPDESCLGGMRTFACEQAGNPRTWQKGTWLQIDTYKQPEASEDEVTDEQIADDDFCSAWEPNGNGCVDKGSLIIIDECQTYFRPRSSSSKVPEFIAAFEVHRHQGLDFWLLTQRPQLLDGNLRALVGRHIHIHTSAMGKKRLEWAEAQDPNSKTARVLANRSSYKPNPKVFDLYRSAQLHTKTKIRLPNGVYMLGALFVVMVLAVTYLYSDFSSKIAPVDASASESVASPFDSLTTQAQPVTRQSATRDSATQAQPIIAATKKLASVDSGHDSISGCFASYRSCKCQNADGSDAGYDLRSCLLYLGLTDLPSRSGSLGFSGSVSDFWAFRRAEWKRLHPNRLPVRAYVAGLQNAYD